MIGATIMIVRDAPSAPIALEQTLARLGHTVCAVASPARHTVERAGELHPDLLLIDLDGGAKGIRVAARTRKRYDIPALYLMRSTDEDLLRQAQATNPLGWVAKPIVEQQLAMSISTALSIKKREIQAKERRVQSRKREIDLIRSLTGARERVHLMKTILDNISDGVIAADLNGEFILFNPVAEEIVGIGAIDATPDKWSKRYGVFYPDGETLYPADQIPLTRTLRGESVQDIELIIRNPLRPQGVRITVSGRPLLDEIGTNYGGVVVLSDITQLKATELELKESIARLKGNTKRTEAILNSVSDGIIATDKHGMITLFNPSAKKFVWEDSVTTDSDHWSQSYGMYYPDKVTPIPGKELPIVRAIRGESVNGMEVYVKNERIPQGAYLSISGRLLSRSLQGVTGGVFVFRDVTHNVHAEQALLDAFSEGKLQMLDTILHNIGNAINTVGIGIGSIAEALKDDIILRRFSSLVKVLQEHQDNIDSYLKDDPQGQNVVPFIAALCKDLSTKNQALNETTERVRQTVSQIVDIIRTERSGKMIAPAYKVVFLEKAINDAVKVLSNSLAKRGIDPVVDCSMAPDEIWIQESRLHQMLVNLVKNSMEAIDELMLSSNSNVNPRIEVRARTDDDFLILDIVDNGVGIDEKHKRRIFSAGFTTKKQGTGLGLHSIANFVIASGGEVQPLSAGIGKGTTMRVKLRLTSLRHQFPVRSSDGR